jgi:hypothetical protein
MIINECSEINFLYTEIDLSPKQKCIAIWIDCLVIRFPQNHDKYLY